MIVLILEASKEDYGEIINIMRGHPEVFSLKEISSAAKFLENSYCDVIFFKYISRKPITDIGIHYEDVIVAFGGYFEYDESDGGFELCYLVVRQDFQGTGIGTKLYKHIEKEIKNQNGKLIVLHAGSGEKNGKFYEKMGFEISGIVPKFYSPNKDLVQYYKVLK